ncbi:Protein of unknown function [Enhydrobacter aerosaccus]|uniref:DUF3592 domain-containing protein n=1 Tax=Enhydrobacter aerosaccus TaxID=225324 RepID=A0A1T4SU33_9HYPH|nr:DUF3592 domain-containing protein [Enhydrobacter aerosaccus]SKA31774.1 Protein of unknown function [Enhydrobacter aerosaccus]
MFRSMPRKPFRLPLLVVALIGVAILGLGAYQTLDTIAFVVRAEHAEARFTGAVARTGGNHGGTFFHPTFEFVTSDGRTIDFTLSSGSTEQPYSAGDHVPILYDPTRPQNAQLISFITLWLIPLVLDAAGALFVSIAVFLWAKLPRR